ncbi:MAG: hypothetical protein U1E06_18170 [Tabrizicola sp.]|uniref:hypothetical protein n=1 Tax=Tabrizicola sp. TaxID=2005166 RepID=UPI0027368A7F|nr:hypothetical protein [Tabrizicola sp.]MDP3262798.1 hypothetical protein [Tabrizicola sp.]MDP3648994.1 hypothetical protein [Paracoccaceae bacterium]MDZ4068732.1 hypothetical protein [Tabrizicola sp.]
MAAALSLTLVTACVQAAPKAAAPKAEAPKAEAPAALRVSNGGQPFAMADGAPARKVAEAECAGRGQDLRTSIYDRFEAGAWVFVEGCV